MQKATTLKEIYRVFDPKEPLTQKEKEFYVDIFAEDMKEISDKLEWSQNDEETLFIAGQPGNGKSTALSLLPFNHPSVKDKYDVIYLYGREKFENTKIDAIDIVLMVGFLFAGKNPALMKTYVDKLEKLRAEKLGEYQKIEESLSSKSKEELTAKESGFKIDLRFLKIGMDFEDEFKYNNEAKITTRKLLRSKEKDFLDATNEVIRKYKQTLKDDKKLLLVIDDIEKSRDSDKVFTDDIGILLQLQCAKIIILPIHLKRAETFAGHDAIELSIKLKEKIANKCINKNIELLLKIIENRIEDNSLISQDAREKIVLMSGGNIRQLTILVKNAALKAKGSESISLGDVEDAIYGLRKQYSSAAQSMDIFLDEIKKHHKPKDYDENSIKLLAIATRQQMVFAYHNSDTWYDINPILTNKEPCKLR